MASCKKHDISVIIATYNRPDALARCLATLGQQAFPREDFEIIVVDDGSESSYRQVQEAFPEVRWLRQANSGPALARNTGAEQARGRILAFIDDDCLAEPNWLQQIAQTFDDTTERLMGGSTPAAHSANIYDQVSQFILSLVYRHYNQRPDKSRFFASNNMAISASLFREVGGFHHQKSAYVSEDRILCDQLLSRGEVLFWNPQAVVYHQPQLTLQGFCRLYFRYGRGAYLYQKARQRGHASEELGFHMKLPLLISQELRATPHLRVPSTLLLLCLWQVSNLVGFLTQALRGDTPR